MEKLLQKRIYYLYHAVSVETSLSYFSEGKIPFFNEEAFSEVDLHLQKRRPNEHGPVLFHVHVGWLKSFIKSHPGPGDIPISMVAKIWLERPPQFEGFLESYQKAVYMVNSNFETELITYREECLSEDCQCHNSSFFDRPEYRMKFSRPS